VVEALGERALLEGDPLIRAALVESLVGGLRWERVSDERMLAVLDPLLGQFARVEDDPYQVGRGLVIAAWSACRQQGHDFPRFVAEHLATSDNPALLREGYLLMGQCSGAESILTEKLLHHPCVEGRKGALEGVREAGGEGRIPPDEILALGRSALEVETDEGMRGLLREMLAAWGARGPPGEREG
jgi:hypothetical protein